MLKILTHKTKRELFTSFSVGVGIKQAAHRHHKSTGPTFEPLGVRRKMCSTFPFFWWLIFLLLHAIHYSDIKFGKPPPCQPFLELWQSFQKPAYPYIFAVPNCASTAVLNPPFAKFFPSHLKTYLDHFTICFWLFPKAFVSTVLWAPEVDVIFQKVYDISKYQH